MVLAYCGVSLEADHGNKKHTDKARNQQRCDMRDESATAAQGQHLNTEVYSDILQET